MEIKKQIRRPNFRGEFAAQFASWKSAFRVFAVIPMQDTKSSGGAKGCMVGWWK